MIEDDPADAHLIRERLAGNLLGPSAAIDLKLMRTGRLDAGLALLAEQHFDVLLLDLSLPDSSGIVNLKKVRAQAPGMPVVVFGGSSDDAAVLEALREGAQEYLVKGHADGAALVRAITSAMARQPVSVDLVSSREPMEDRLDSAGESGAEAAYRHSILDAIDEGLTVSGPDGVISFANARLCEMLGLTADELIGKHSLSLYFPEERRHALTETEQGHKGAKSFYGSMLVAKEGPGIPVFVTATPLRESGQFAGTVTTFTVIKELNNLQVERALQASVVESSVDAITSQSLEGIISSWNRGAELLYGYLATEVIGERASAYVPAELADEIPDMLERVKRGETIERFETVRLKRNGERVAVSMAISPILDQAGWVVGVSSIGHGIAARQQPEVLAQLPSPKNDSLRDVNLLNTDRLDLQVTLNILLDQVISRLHVDSAAVLLLKPDAQILECAAARGYHSHALAGAPVRVGEAFAGQAALERKIVSVPDLAHVPEKNERARLLRAEGFRTYFGVPLIAKNQCRGVLEIVTRARMKPDLEWFDFLQIIAGQGAIAIESVSIFDELQKSHFDLALAYDSTIVGWSHALSLRNKETQGHTQRVTDMMLQLARVMGMSDAELVQVRRGALLHDIGKMSIPDSILLKPGPLTDAEWAIVRLHPIRAYEMLAPIDYLRPALDIPYCHHEKRDGGGYPRQLRGEEIPLAARAFAVVDVWDALRSDRPYREAWPPERVSNYIWSEAGKQFDPGVTSIFLGQKSYDAL